MSETKKVMTKVDQSTKALTKTISDLTKVAGNLEALSTATEALTTEIQVKEGELAAIEQNVKESERQANAELKVRIVENEDRVLSQLLTARGLANISQADVNSLKDSLANAEADNTNEIEMAVSKANQAAAIKYNAEKSKLESDHAVATAELKADKAALQNKVEFLEETVTSLKAMIEAEREARVKMSENASQPTINVSSGK